MKLGKVFSQEIGIDPPATYVCIVIVIVYTYVMYAYSGWVMIYLHIYSCMYACCTGGILAGLVSDILKARAFTSVTALYLSIPSVSL